ncbi:putative L-rhamnose mutarotase [Glarea lozoyensis 74030]|uniref:Putative L-rhamnose mutarotase n=1 Tax=Glarea lozoyensis (strain ATCC 74030 / MF5533) TaxID=1104152 RepID=H0EGW7_GLAL7|nr:putative L-rhamnose mutarotase [Glarea lozoyensis 74030]
MWATSSAEPKSPLWSPPTPIETTTHRPSGPSIRLKNQGRRIAQIVKLKPEYVEEYKKCHAKVWPEVLKQIKESNIEDYSIFHDPGTGILFASFKRHGEDAREPEGAGVVADDG